MNHYTLAPFAASDLDGIWTFIASEAGLNTADGLLDAITQRFLMLATHPEAGRARPDIGEGVRCFPVRSFVIYYRATVDGVLIARVLHGHRDQQSNLG